MRALADFFEAVVKEGPLVAGYRLNGEPYGDHCDVAIMAPVQGLLKVNIFFLSWNVTGCCCGPAGGCLNVARSNGLSPAAPRGTAQLQVSALSAGIAMCVTSPFTNHWGDARTTGSCSPAVQAKSLAGSKQIEQLLDGEVAIKLAKPDKLGRAKRVDGEAARYIEFAKMTLPRHMSLDGMRVVVDCANGAAYRVAPEALWELGAEVFSIGVEPDGFNINRRVGSTAPEALVAKVREMRADIGIALDGDADRVIVVDERGKVVDGDQLMAAVAEYWKEDGRLSQPGIVATLMSNLGLERYLGTIGLSMARTAVGDRYVLEHMRQHGYNLGGEQSGHIILSDYVTTGDGLIAGLQVMGLVKRRGRPVSEVCRRFEPVPQILKNVRFEDGRKVPEEKLAAAVEAGRARLGTSGRLIVRPSGTEPLMRVMGEGDDADLVEKVVDDVCEALSAAA